MYIRFDRPMPDPAANPMDAHQAVLDQLIAYGLEVEHLETNGVLRRVRHRDDKRGRKDGWYVAHEFTTSAGRVLIAGAFGCWRDECGPYRIGAQRTKRLEEMCSVRAREAAQDDELPLHRRDRAPAPYFNK